MSEQICAICGYIRHPDKFNHKSVNTPHILKNEICPEGVCPVCHAPADLFFFDSMKSDFEMKK